MPFSDTHLSLPARRLHAKCFHQVFPPRKYSELLELDCTSAFSRHMGSVTGDLTFFFKKRSILNPSRKRRINYNTVNCK